MSYRPGSTPRANGITGGPPPPSLPSRPPHPAGGYPANYHPNSNFPPVSYAPAASGIYNDPTANGTYAGYHNAHNAHNGSYNTYGAHAAPKQFTSEDAAHAAEVAQWNAAYINPGKPTTKAGTTTPTTAMQTHSPAPIGPAIGSDSDEKAAAKTSGRGMTVLRKGGLQKWEDKSLLEWNPEHPRLFVGNLAGEVTDDSLLKAFSRYSSVVKARVVRDKKTTKSKGFGFVSFSNSEDYFNAFKEMAGKYVGSHPITLSKAKSNVNPVDTEYAEKMLLDKKKKKKGKQKQVVRLEELNLEPDLTMDDVIAQYDNYQKMKKGSTITNSPTTETFGQQDKDTAAQVADGTAAHDYAPGTASRIAGRADTGAGVQKTKKKKKAKPALQVLG